MPGPKWKESAPRVAQKETRRLANRGSYHATQHKANYFGAFSTILDASCRIIQALKAFVAVEDGHSCGQLARL
jgi:hypothetical protein